MKQVHSNKKIKLAGFVLALTLLAVSLSSCKWFGDLFKPKAEDGVKAVTVLTVNQFPSGDANELLPADGGVGSIGFETESRYVIDALYELKGQDKIGFTGSDHGYGFFIDSIDGVDTEQSRGEYVMVAVRLKDDAFDERFMGVDDEFNKPVIYGGKTYYSTLVGVSGVPLSDGMEILFYKIVL
jgi:hypothetical protein